jgi:hypothetical protein
MNHYLNAKEMNNMISITQSPRKLSYLFAIVVVVCSITAMQAQSTNVGGGTLTWNTSQSTGICGPWHSFTFTEWNFTNFQFAYQGANYPLGGSAAYFQDNNSTTGCPPNGPQGGVFLIPSSAGFGSSCLLNFSPGYGGQGGASLSASCSQGVQGYIDPKYVVLGVTYAPPGSKSSVAYTNSKSVGTTSSIINSFSSGTTYTVSIANSIGVFGWTVGTKISNVNAASQSSKDTQSVTLNWGVSDSVTTYGVPDDFSPVDSDYDVIYVWLNPVEVLTLSGKNVTWNGYGYDATDQNGMDIVGIPLGYLNGRWAMPAGLLALTNRAWAAGQMYAPGQSAALNSADFAQIATFDPFSNSSYGPSQIGFVPPIPSTYDNRFTLTTCNAGNSVSYLQAAPSQTPGPYTCTLNYSTLTTTAQALTTSSTNTFSIDRSYAGSIFSNNLTFDFQYAYTVSTQTEVDSSIATTQSSSSVANITGPACGNSVLGVGPCIPVYDALGNEPEQFDIYQDNLYGTFMFAPVHYY